MTYILLTIIRVLNNFYSFFLILNGNTNEVLIIFSIIISSGLINMISSLILSYKIIKSYLKFK